MNLRPLTNNTEASFIPVLLYLIGLIMFGFMTWLLDGILGMFRALGIHNTTDFGAYDILVFIWYSIVVLYLIFGAIWLIRTYNEPQHQGGFF